MRPIELREDAPAKPEHDAATELARRAGALLLDLRSRSPHSKRALSDEGDRCSHEFLMAQLATRFPQDPVRSEEGHDSPGAERLWVIDPLDGSREYGEGREDWAVHVALAEGGRPAVGAVALPARGMVLGTSEPPPLAEAATALAGHGSRSSGVRDRSRTTWASVRFCSLPKRATSRATSVTRKT